jgi:ABC-type methionine transport system permease subunit
MACIKGMAYYMHTSEMKKKGFMKNKVVERIVKTNVNKATLIPFIQRNPTIF